MREIKELEKRIEALECKHGNMITKFPEFNHHTPIKQCQDCGCYFDEEGLRRLKETKPERDNKIRELFDEVLNYAVHRGLAQLSVMETYEMKLNKILEGQE